MSDNVTAIKGFADLFSPDSDAFTHMEAVARETFSRYGFTELRTPILERTELFAGASGRKPTWSRRKCIPSPTARAVP